MTADSAGRYTPGIADRFDSLKELARFLQDELEKIRSATEFGVLDEDDMASDSDEDVPTQQSVKAYVDTQVAGSGLVGAIQFWDGDTPPSGWLEHDGSLISMTNRPQLTDHINGKYGLDAGTNFTADDVNDEIDATAHGLSDNDIVRLTTTGTLPGGLSIETNYYVVNAAADTFQVAATQGGSAIDITDTGSGTHSFHTQFYLPNDRGQFFRGYDHGAGVDPDAASRTDRGDGTTGDAVGTLQSWAIENISGKFEACEFGNSTKIVGAGTTGPFSSDGSGGSDTEVGGVGGGPRTRIHFDASDDVQTSSEARPANRQYMVIRKDD